LASLPPAVRVPTTAMLLPSTLMSISSQKERLERGRVTASIESRPPPPAGHNADASPRICKEATCSSNLGSKGTCVGLPALASGDPGTGGGEISSPDIVRLVTCPWSGDTSGSARSAQTDEIPATTETTIVRSTNRVPDDFNQRGGPGPVTATCTRSSPVRIAAAGN
jgi:hypothetical protein